MLPFYHQFRFYNPFIDPSIYVYAPMVAQQQKIEHKYTPTIVKQQQQAVQYKSQEDSSEKQGKIKLDLRQLQKQGYQVTKRLWSEKQDELLVHSVEVQSLSWEIISKLLPARNSKMCYNRYKRLKKKKKNLWSQEEDQKLKFLVEQRKIKWKHLQKHFQSTSSIKIDRKAKQLRQRYLNFLRSNISREPWTLEQDFKLIQCVNQIGKKWKQIQKVLTNRSQNQLKNRYYGRIQHVLKKKGQNVYSNDHQP